MKNPISWSNQTISAHCPLGVKWCNSSHFSHIFWCHKISLSTIYPHSCLGNIINKIDSEKTSLKYIKNTQRYTHHTIPSHDLFIAMDGSWQRLVQFILTITDFKIHSATLSLAGQNVKWRGTGAKKWLGWAESCPVNISLAQQNSVRT